MEFIETLVFSRAVQSVMSHDEYMELQEALIVNPFLGRVIQGGHGLRKLRWSIEGKGKSGGVRLIYYYLVIDDVIYMMKLYKKSEQEDLTKAQLKILMNYLKQEGI